MPDVEADLVTLLRTLCPRVHPDVAPTSTARPYITYQGIGGQALRYVDGTASNARHTLLQINVWADSRAAALALMRQVEDAMCAPTAPFTARPEAEPINTAEEDLRLYGCIQDFSVWANR